MEDLISAYTYAIINEIKSQNLYSMLAIACEEEESSKIFADLEKIEKSHEEKVTNLFKEKFPDEKLELDHNALPDFKNSVMLDNPGQILEYAISREFESEDDYRNLAERSDEEEIKKIFLQLAEEEKTHGELLRMEIHRLQDLLLWFEETELNGLFE